MSLRLVYVDGWSSREEAIIRNIVAREHVERIEAVRRMRRRRLDDLRRRILTPEQVQAIRLRNACRQDGNSQSATRKGGRPSKYRTERSVGWHNASNKRLGRGPIESVSTLKKTPSQVTHST